MPDQLSPECGEWKEPAVFMNYSLSTCLAGDQEEPGQSLLDKDTPWQVEQRWLSSLAPEGAGEPQTALLG